MCHIGNKQKKKTYICNNVKYQHLEILLNDIWSLSAYVLIWFITNQTIDNSTTMEFLRAKLHIDFVHT